VLRVDVRDKPVDTAALQPGDHGAGRLLGVSPALVLRRHGPGQFRRATTAGSRPDGGLHRAHQRATGPMADHPVQPELAAVGRAPGDLPGVAAAQLLLAGRRPADVTVQPCVVEDNGRLGRVLDAQGL
jgi:hypothetical protein